MSLRLIGCLAAAATICAAWSAGQAVAGRAGARWAAVITTAVVSAPTIGSPQVSGELLAMPFVLGAVALALHAVGERTVAPLRLAAAAGTLAACGPLLKQNLFDGLLAIGSVLLVAALVRHAPRRRLLGIAVVALVSAVATTVLVLGWSTWRGTSVPELWQVVVLFRADATSVISAEATAATRSRFLVLALIFAIGGPLALTLLALRTARRTPSPGAVTAVVLLAWAVVSIVAGGSYWAHYLVQLAPGLGLAVAAALASDRRGRRMARVVTTCTATVAMVSAVLGLGVDRIPSTDREVAGEYLAAMTRPGDTAVVAWGHPSILQEAGVQSPYEQLWSLPVRVHDTELTDFVQVLEGPEAPDWVVTRGGTVDSWGIDAPVRTRSSRSATTSSPTSADTGSGRCPGPRTGCRRRRWRTGSAPRSALRPTAPEHPHPVPRNSRRAAAQASVASRWASCEAPGRSTRVTSCPAATNRAFSGSVNMPSSA